MYDFINPYNFIPMEPYHNTESYGKEENPADEKENRYSGCIEYSVLTKTPLFIPNTGNDHAFRRSKGEDPDHKSYDFYSYTDLTEFNSTNGNGPAPARPVIPGSEMRGLIRSNYEILTDSCLSAFDTQVVLSKRTMESFKSGLLQREKEGFSLYDAKNFVWPEREAEDHLKKNDDAEYFREGEHVSFVGIRRERNGREIDIGRAAEVTKWDGKKNGNKSEGYLIKGMKGPDMGNPRMNKHNFHIFMPTRTMILKQVDLTKLELTLKEYQKNGGDSSYKEYREEFDHFRKGQRSETDNKEKDCFPVYYSIIHDGAKGTVYYLSPACKTREVYNTSLAKIAEQYRKPCTSITNLCPACELFGTVIAAKNGEADARASRIRFTDLPAVGDQIGELYERPCTLKPLSSPKISSTEFYLKRPENADFWTYDYYVVNGTVKLYIPTLAGRKFYWHNLSVNGLPHSFIEKEDNRTNQNVTVRPVKTGVSFKGRVYFKDLRKTELDTLLYAMVAGDADSAASKKHGYKLGQGKPLGLGSIAIEINNVKLSSYHKNIAIGTVEHVLTDYQDVKKAETESSGLHSTDAFKKMTDFYTITITDNSVHVDYPRAAENGDIFKWFSDNRRNTNGGNTPKSRDTTKLNQWLEPMQVKIIGGQLQDTNVYNSERNILKGFQEGEIGKTGSNAKGDYAYIINPDQPGKNKDYKITKQVYHDVGKLHKGQKVLFTLSRKAVNGEIKYEVKEVKLKK